MKRSHEIVAQVQEMADTMKSAFKDNLAGLEWMSEISREAAKAKLEHMVDLIGFPDFVLNASLVDSVFTDLSIDPDSYLMNIVAHRSFDRQLQESHVQEKRRK